MAWIVPVITAAQQEDEDTKLLAALATKDTEDRYEFKILHGPARIFGNGTRLQAVLEEERQAQWELVMKLDDQRLVLRRPRRTWAYSPPEGTRQAGAIDPYRTQIGASSRASYAAVMVGLLVTGIATMAWIGVGRPDLLDSGIWTMLTTILMMLVVAVLIKVKMGRGR
jgi:hypothetical protein